jgi:hypothetical protein
LIMTSVIEEIDLLRVRKCNGFSRTRALFNQGISILINIIHSLPLVKFARLPHYPGGHFISLPPRRWAWR